MQRRGVRKAPQDGDKGRQRDDRAQQADADVERAIDEQLDVVGHALVGVVGGVALKLHPVVVGLVQPFAEILRGHPAPPADLQPLIEIELVDRDHDEDGGQDAEIDDFGDEVVPVVFLQRVVEAAVPLVEQDGDRDDGQLNGDHRRQQPAAGPFVFGTEIGGGDAPHGGERRADIVHRLPSPGMGLTP